MTQIAALRKYPTQYSSFLSFLIVVATLAVFAVFYLHTYIYYLIFFFFIIISFRSALLLLVFVAYNATPARSCNYSDDRAVAADGLLTSTEVDADSDASVASKRNCVATEAVCACIFFFVSPA